MEIKKEAIENAIKLVENGKLDDFLYALYCERVITYKNIINFFKEFDDDDLDEFIGDVKRIRNF